MCPPAPFTLRKALKDVKLRGSGVQVPKGTQVLVFFQSAHVGRHWDDPEQFIPERWGNAEICGEGDKVPGGAYLPFSAGVRNCAGQFFAEYEGLLILAELFRRFDISLACEPTEVVKATGFVQGGRYSSKKNGHFDMGIPLRIKIR